MNYDPKRWHWRDLGNGREWRYFRSDLFDGPAPTAELSRGERARNRVEQIIEMVMTWIDRHLP